MTLLAMGVSIGSVAAAVGGNGRANGPFVWTDNGHPTIAAGEAIALLAAAADEGLVAEDYRAAALDQTAASLRAGSADAAILGHFDQALTDALARYVHDVHAGRVDPRRIGFLLDRPDDRHDFHALVRAAAAANRVGALVAGYRPPMRQYAALRVALRRYRTLDEAPPLPASPRSIHPGEPYAGVARVAERLMQLGDLAPDARVAPGDRYSGELVEAVRRFQLRHGLDADGVLGKATIAAMQTPVRWRVRQIELALERLRWLPHITRSRLIVLNIPMFQLWGWSGETGAAEPWFTTDVIVGRALSTATPVMAKELREIIFRPYWNIPRSILVREILPLVQKDAAYLARHEMEIVAGESDRAASIAPSPEALARLRRGELRLRQRPGPRNALGLIKFVFPNDEHVYMHGTPAQALFSRSRRDFSHGCVRVKDPVGLAEWVLAAEAGWSRQRIVEATAGAGPRSVSVNPPVHVWLFYTTAAVMPDGTVRFAEDIYRHDLRLDRALSVRPVSPLPGTHAAHVDVDEVGRGVETDAAASQ